MTGPREDMGPEMGGDEGLAAEFVLGTLPLEDRMAAERRIGREPAFAAMVAEWEERLSGLNGAYAEVPAPPELMARVEARLFPVAARTRRPVWQMLLSAGIAAALAAGVAVVVLPPLTGPAAVTAELTGEGQALVVAASYDPGGKRLTVTRRAGGAAEAGRDYQLWLIPAGQAPVPLGLIREGELDVPVDALPAGTTLAVSLEPAGGSPTGQPTGPVLVAAVIAG
ncbi:MAG: anti-sigma factor domain-containing protein [Paracoccaceae bacterium]